MGTKSLNYVQYLMFNNLTLWNVSILMLHQSLLHAVTYSTIICVIGNSLNQVTFLWYLDTAIEFSDSVYSNAIIACIECVKCKSKWLLLSWQFLLQQALSWAVEFTAQVWTMFWGAFPVMRCTHQSRTFKLLVSALPSWTVFLEIGFS